MLITLWMDARLPFDRRKCPIFEADGADVVQEVVVLEEVSVPADVIDGVVEADELAPDVRGEAEVKNGVRGRGVDAGVGCIQFKS